MLTSPRALPWRSALSRKDDHELSSAAAREARRREIQALLEEIRAQDPAPDSLVECCGEAEECRANGGRLQEAGPIIARPIW
jgi:hypothetical protein